MNFYRQRAIYISAALAIAIALLSTAAHAERVSISVANIGLIALDFETNQPRADNFSSIKIRTPAGVFRFRPKSPIAKLPFDPRDRLSSGLPDRISGLRLDPSRLFFRGEFISDTQPHTLLFFLGETGASDASPILVIGFSYLGVPYKVLELGEFDPTSFLRAGDNTALIIGKNTLSQVMGGDGGNGSKGPYATTYDPFSVFVLHVEGDAYYSLAASRRYNEEHYVWAGPHSREDYAVYFNVPGRKSPFGAPATQMSKILANAGVPNLK